MKKLLLPLMLLCALLFPACAEKVSIIVATDLHYISPALTDNGPFFTQLVENADGKVMLYIDPLCEAFVEQVIEKKPDCLILSGDLTFNGEKQSHIDLSAKLQRVKAAGIPVLVMPGNHDLNASAHAFKGDGYSQTDTITAEEFRIIYAAMGYDDALARDASSLSYVWQLSSKLRILMLDVNTQEAPGMVHPHTLSWIQAQLESAREEGQHIIAVSHQNLLGHNALFSAGYVIGNHDELYTLYAQSPVVINLSGHMHMQHIITQSDTPEIVTSALSVSPNQYGVLTLSDVLTYHTEPVDVAAWAAKKGLQDENLLNFSAYSKQFFQKIAYAQGLSSITAPAEDSEGMAHWFSHLNTCYFSGRMDWVDAESPYRKAWYEQPSFMAFYINSMFEEALKNHTQLTLPLE